jgi:mannose-6-phosphate isomerase-like protein (cupin superfamily)
MNRTKKVWYGAIIGVAVIGVILFMRNSIVLYKSETAKFLNENIIELVKQNSFYRKEIITGLHSQVVIMNILVGQEIGEEIHDVDQTFFFVEGHGQAIINDVDCAIHPQHLLFVPAGTRHNIKNSGSENLKLFTIYAPAEHKPGTIEKTKKE